MITAVEMVTNIVRSIIVNYIEAMVTETGLDVMASLTDILDGAFVTSDEINDVGGGAVSMGMIIITFFSV